MKILVIKRDKIGDLLLTTPMLAHLRASLPDAQIHVLATSYNAWVVADNPNIDRLWIYRRARTGRRMDIGAVLHQIWQRVQLRREHFDVAIAAGGDFSPRALKRALAVGAKRTIAYCKAGQLGNPVSDPLELPREKHEVERMLALLAPLGIAPPAAEIYPCYQPPATSHEFAGEWLKARGLTARDYVVLGLGARRAKKQPSTEQILRWAARLKNQYRLDMVFMWTPGKGSDPLYPGDDEIAEPVVAQKIPYIHPFRGPIPPALGLIWHARASIFPDSGLMHFAAASPGGVLGLFAETDVSPHPRQWGPRGPKAFYLDAEKSVTELSDEQVFEKLAPLLK